MRMKIIYNMREKFQAIAMTDSGLVCDNVECSYEYPVAIEIGDLHHFIDAECPKCKENLLTEEDYIHHRSLKKIIKFINILLWPYMFLRGGRKPEEESLLRYHHHAGKTTIEEGGQDEGL